MKNAACFFLFLVIAAHADDADYASSRAAMVGEVEYYATLARDADDARFDEDVIHALATVGRHEFVPRQQQSFCRNGQRLFRPLGA